VTPGTAAPSLGGWATGSLLAAGLLAALVRVLRRQRVTRPAGASGGRLAAWYERTRGGRRLEARLRRAMIPTTPSRWRAGQLLVAIPTVLALVTALGPGAGIGLGVGAVRMGTRLLLHVRGGRRAAALERAASDLARSLCAELSAGVSVEEALAAASASLCAFHPVLRPLLDRAMRRTSAGDPAGAALTASLVTEPEAAGAGLAAVAALLSLQGRGGGDPIAFDRLARALELALATEDDARAMTAEARMAAVAVPALAAALGVALVATQPAVASGVRSPAAAATLACCVLAAVGAAALARRLAAGT
jgi:Flp pilus assembly protein TadB